MKQYRRLWMSVGVMAAALGIYAHGAFNSPLLDGTLAQHEAYRQNVLATEGLDPDREEALAQAYWRRYGDVRADPYFGENGQLGVFGAREHYMRHGRREGRIWLEPAKRGTGGTSPYGRRFN